MSAENRRLRRAVSVAAILVPASEGGLLPAGLVLLAVTAQALRRLTSPESRRA